MSEILLKTKLYIPALRPKLVSRSRLIALLKAGLSHKLSLVSAPAGSGKTTLVSDFAQQIDRPVAWMSLDQGDNDPLRFMTYLLAGLKSIETSLGCALQPLLTSQTPPTPEMSVTMLINDIAVSNKEIVLVLDDYHVIKSTPVHDTVSFLLDNSPSNLSMVITSRTNPPLPLARLRARGQLTEVRAADLRFTEDETTAFMSEVMGLHLEDQTISFLESRTEGWIAGLQLAALSLKHPDDEKHLVKTFSGRDNYVLDYLVDEVLNQQSEQARSFLLRTSILDRFTGPLCHAVTGQDDCSAVISNLEQANLFLVPLDNERKWFRYHHLFAEFLRARFEEQIGAEEKIALHHRASEWHRDNGFLNEAVEHAFLAADHDSAAKMIENAADELYSRGEIGLLYNLLSNIPEKVRRRRIRSSIYYAWVLLFVGEPTGDILSLADDYIRGAESIIRENNDEPSTEELGMIYAVRTAMASWSPVRRSAFCAQKDLANIIRCGQRALSLLQPKNLVWRCVVNAGLGDAYNLIGSVKEATSSFTEAARLGAAGGNLAGALSAYASWAELLIQQGTLHEAERVYRDGLRVAAARNADMFPVTGQIYDGLGRLFYEWNDLTQAAHYLSEAIRRFEMGDVVPADSILLLALVRRLQDDNAAAKELHEQATEIMAAPDVRNSDLAKARVDEVRLMIAEGKTSEAAKLAITMTPELGVEPDPWIEKEYLSLARVLIKQGKSEKILVTLEKLKHHATVSGRTGDAIEISATLATAYQANGRTGDALLLLKESLGVAEESHYIRTFADQDNSLASLLNEVYQTSKRGDQLPCSKAYLEGLLIA
ncbi:MAG TPA: hypothetical protein VFC63_22890, partial [Blastocatellia bacterium]|nr:hypothetical protein [Blastocatellia bacterium]